MGDDAGSSLCRCGAMLPLPDLAGLITCPSCGRVTKPPPVPGPGSGGWQPPPPIAGAPPPRAAAPAPRPGASSGASGCRGPIVLVAVVLVLAAMGSVAAVVGLRSSEPGAGDGGGGRAIDVGSVLSGTGTVLPAAIDGDPGATRVALTVQEAGATTVRRLAMATLGAEGSSLEWTSDPLPPDAYEVTVLEHGDALVASVEAELRVLDAATGAERWRTTLRDRLSPSCRTCLAVVDGVVVVRTDDAYVVAYDLASGEERWERRLRSTVATMATTGSGIVVVDDPEDASALTPVELLDLGTGRTAQATAPTCDPDDPKPWSIELSPSTAVHAVAGTDDAVAAFGFGATCVVRWNPVSGEIRWAVEVPGSGSFRDDDALLGPDHLVLSDGAAALVSVALADGAIRSLEVPADTRAVPSAVVDGALVAATATTRGTARHGLAAWDLPSGERRWAERPVPDAEPVSMRTSWSSDALFEGSPRSLLAVDGSAAHLLVFDGGNRTTTSYPVDLATGAVGEAQRRGFASDGLGTPSLAVEGVAGGRAIVTVDSLVQAFPLTGRGPVVTFP